MATTNICFSKLSTPSLGITDHSAGSPGSVYQVRLLAFNSLSRDHSLRAPPLVHGPLPVLSTPSLGITLRDVVLEGMRELSGAFNSLSRDHNNVRIARAEVIKRFLSTPSLGITRVLRRQLDILGLNAFNSLSRDHRARFRDFPALRGFLPRHPFAQMISKTTIWIYLFAPL